MLDDRDRTYTMEDIEQETGFDRRTIAYYVQEGLLPRVGRRGPRTRYPRHYLDRLLFIKKVRDLQNQGQLGNYTLEDIRDIFDTVPQRMIADIVAGREPLEVAPYGGARRGLTTLLGSPRERIERLRSLSERPRPTDAPRGTVADDTLPVSWSRHRRSSPRAVDDPTVRSARPVAPDASEQSEPRKPTTPDPSPRTEPADDDALFLDLDTPHQELMVRRVVDDLAAAPASSRRLERRVAPPPSTLARMLAQLDEAAGHGMPGESAERWIRAEVTPEIVLTVRGLGEDEVQLLERIARVLRGMIEGRRGR
jgi:DNA-binding transcriptional MerR regulator